MRKNIIKLTESELRDIVNSCVLDVLNESRDNNLEDLVKTKVGEELEIFRLFEDARQGGSFKEIKYFSPDGSTMPNGIGFQRGNFLRECKINREAFELDEAIHNNQYGLSDYRGGVIVFSTDVNAVALDKNKLSNKVKQILATLNQRLNTSKISHNVINSFNKYNDEFIGAYSIGNAFKGKYVGDNGEAYNERSTTIEVNGLSSQGLLRLAEMIARVFHQETVLVKDFNNMKFFLVNGHREDTPANYDIINQKAE